MDYWYPGRGHGVGGKMRTLDGDGSTSLISGRGAAHILEH